MEFRIRDDFDETAPPLPLLCEDESDNGKVKGSIQQSFHRSTNFMSRFLRDNEVFNAAIPNEFTADFKDNFPDNTTETISGSLGDTIGVYIAHLMLRAGQSIPLVWLCIYLLTTFMPYTYLMGEKWSYLHNSTVSSIKYKDQL